MRGLCLAAMLACAPVSGTAQTLDTALAAWLDGDDATALPMLATLAGGGDATAQLTLAMIDLRQASPFILALTPEARRAIFRKAGGKFGTPWIRVAQAGPQAALAQALFPDVALADYAKVAQVLRDAGEPGHAARAIMALNNQDPAELVAYDATHRLPASMRWLVWSAAHWATTYTETTDAMTAVLAEAATAPDGLQRWVYLSMGGAEVLGLTLTPVEAALARDLRSGEVVGFREGADVDTSAAMEAVLMAAPETAALRAACMAGCAGMEPACTRALYSLVGGVAGMISLTSPLEAAIDQDRYEASPRYLMDLREVSQNVPREKITPAPGASCAFALVDAH
jgi:hypothetical protein